MEKVLSKGGVSIAVDKTGKGPALVLVDGAFCSRDYGVTPKLVPLLSNFFTVYSYDRRGRGESSDAKNYTVEYEIEDLKNVIEKTGEVPFICGFSSGAAIVLQAMGKGVKVKKIALFEPPYVGSSTIGTPPPGDAEKILTNLVKQGKRGEAVKYFMTKVMRMPAFIVFMFKLFGKTLWEKNLSVAHTLAYDVAIMGDYTVPKDIAASIHVPTVVIGGEKSPPNIRIAMEEVIQAIPQSQIRWLKGQRHNVSMEVIAPCLIDFFKL